MSAYTLYKNATIGQAAVAGIGKLIGSSVDAVAEMGTKAAVGLLAAAALGATGVGYLASKVTEKSPTDIDTAQKSYEDKRLGADLNYLHGKLRSEYEAYKNKTDRKAARLF